MGIGTIDGVVSAVITVLGAAFGVGRWIAKRVRKRRIKKAAKERLSIQAGMEGPAAELRPQGVRRAAARPVRRPRRSWVFNDSSGPRRGWVHRWRDW